MSWMLPLPVVIPLLAAAANVAGDHVLPRRVGDAIGLLGVLGSLVFSAFVAVVSMRQETLHWFGGWRPRSGVAIGIAFAADPLGAGMAVLAALLVLLALVYSLTYLREAARSYDVLLLVFCGAMCGFALTGDLFNMFVWFELMGVAAYALAGFKVRDLGPLQGAVNMAVTNTIGAYLIVTGLALVYARTGALNLAQIGRTLSGQKPDGLVVVALTLLVVGFLVKAAVVPFHLWLADAHAVAPAPVCVLFSGVMVELGLLGVARCYWTIFDGPFGSHQHEIRGLLLVLGVVTALLGAVMCFLQSHLKRLLAYSTISHAGVMLVGIALLDSKSLAGTALMVIGHGLLKGALFLCGGILLVETQSIDELRLHGRGRGMPILGGLFALAAAGLIGAPYVGTYAGHAAIDEGATLNHIAWVQPLLAIAAGVSTGAILRACARIFLGWGPADDDLLTHEPPEKSPTTEKVTPMLLAVTAVMVVLGLAVSLVPGLGQRAVYGAERFRDRAGYAERVLHDAPTRETARLPFAVQPTATESLIYGCLATVLTIGAAAVGLWRRRLPFALRRASERLIGAPVEVLRAAHTGLIGDYVMWLTVGTAVIGGVWAFTLR
jgi:multicomponent Na+:H+ antiporter subunit D